MKKILVALGLLAALAAAAGAQTAGTNTVERNGYYFNATTGQRTNADGSAYVVDEAAAWNFAAFNHTLFNADTMSIGSYQDSSAFYATGPARQMFLHLRADIPTGTAANMFVRLAVQVRQAYSNPDAGDTTLIALWQPSVIMGASTATANDSLAYNQGGRAGTGGGGVASGSAVAGSSEFVVTLYDFTNVATSAPSSAFSSMWLPLADNRGVFAWAPYTQLRIRVLACGTGNTPKITANLVGRP